MFSSSDWPHLLLLMLIGAIVATLGDAVHAYTGALSYPEPAMGEQAWWVFPGFFVAFGVVVYGYRAMSILLEDRLLMEQSSAPNTLTDFSESLTLFAVVYFASGVGNAYPSLLCFTFFGLFILRVAVTYERAWLVSFAVSLAISGVLVEVAFCSFGIVTYRTPDFPGVPWWLAGLYLHGAFTVREGMRYFYFQRFDGYAP